MEKQKLAIGNRLWLSGAELAELLGVSEGTLRIWRCADRRNGADGWRIPGRANIRYRRFGKSVKYYMPDVLTGGPQIEAQEVRAC
jgi:hypothetical protein